MVYGLSSGVDGAEVMVKILAEVSGSDEAGCSDDVSDEVSEVQMMRFQQVEKIQQTEKIQLVQKMFQLVVRKMMQQQWQQHLNCSGHLQAPSSMDPHTSNGTNGSSQTCSNNVLAFTLLSNTRTNGTSKCWHNTQTPSIPVWTWGHTSVLEHTWLGTLWQLIINSVSKTIDRSSLATLG